MTRRPSDRELAVLHLMALGHSNESAGAVLGIAADTVKQHVKNSREKMGAKTKTHAVYLATTLGWFESKIEEDE